jgi:hypothetical protein
MLEPQYIKLAERYHRLDKVQPWSKWELSKSICGSEVPMHQLRDTLRHFFIAALERGCPYPVLDASGPAASRLLEAIPAEWRTPWMMTLERHDQCKGEGAPGLLSGLVSSHLLAQKEEIRRAANVALDGLWNSPQGPGERPSVFMDRLLKFARDTQAHYVTPLQADPESTVRGLWFLFRMRPEIRDFLIHGNDAGHPDPPPLLYDRDNILDLDYRLEDYSYTVFCQNRQRNAAPVATLAAVEAIPRETPQRGGQRVRNRRPAAEPITPETRREARERLWTKYGTGPQSAPRILPREGLEAVQAYQDTVRANVCYRCLASDHIMRDCPSEGSIRTEWDAFRTAVLKGRPSAPGQPSTSN